MTRRSTNYKKGDKVTITDGAHRGWTGTYISMDPENYMRILVAFGTQNTAACADLTRAELIPTIASIDPEFVLGEQLCAKCGAPVEPDGDPDKMCENCWIRIREFMNQNGYTKSVAVE